MKYSVFYRLPFSYFHNFHKSSGAPLTLNMYSPDVCCDLSFNNTYAKYVDDSTVLSKNVSLCKLSGSLAQSNGMIINTNETKELIICFSKKS